MTFAGFIATHLVAQEIMWVREQLGEMGHPQLEPTVLGEDSMHTIAIINNASNRNKTRQIQFEHLVSKEMTDDFRYPH